MLFPSHDRLTRYIQDPVALLTNQVWSVDLEKTSDLVFDYRIQSVDENNINKVTSQFLVDIVINEGKTNISNDEFIIEFLKRLTNYLKINGVSPAALSFYGIPTNVNFDNFKGPVSLLYLWLAQIFAVNSKGTALTKGQASGQGQLNNVSMRLFLNDPRDLNYKDTGS